jgi:hypothetical protein
MIQVSCPACSKTLQVREEFAGKKARCPSCQDVLSIPSLQIQPGGGPPPLPGGSVSNDFEEVMPIDEPPHRSGRFRDEEGDFEPAGGSRLGLWLGIGIPVLLLVLGGAGWGIYALVSDKKDDKVADSGSGGTVTPTEGGSALQPVDNGNAVQAAPEPVNPAVAELQDTVVGKWKLTDFGLIYEFNRDGTYSSPGGPGGRGATKGTYKVIDEKTMEMTSGGVTKRMAMTLTTDKLELTTSAQLTNVKGTEADKLKGTSMDFTLSFVRADVAGKAPTKVAQGNPNGGSATPPMTVPMPTDQPKPGGNVKELLPGRFIAKNQFGGKDEVWVFTADNQFYYEGRDMVHGTFRYVSEDVIDLKPNNFGFTAAYGGERKVEVTEKTLRLSGKFAPGTGNTFERFQGGNTTVVRADTPKPNTPKPNTPKPRPGMEAPPGTPWPQKKSAESDTKVEILEEYTFEAKENVNRVALSPDGKTLAVAWDNIHLYDVTVNPPRKKADLPKGHPFLTRALVFSPNGRFLASAGHDRMMHVWDLSEATPKEIPVPKVHDGGINTLAFSPNGNLLASGADDKAIVLWDVSGDKVTERSVLKLPASRVAQGITSLSFSPNGNLLAAAGHGVWQVWDINKRVVVQANQIKSLRHSEMPIAYSPDGKILVLVADNVMHYLNGRQTGILVGHGDRITAVSFSPDGRTLASVSEDGKIILWDVPALKQREIKVRPGRLTSVAFSPLQTEALKSADQLLAVGNHNNSFTMLHLGYPEK